MDKSIKSKIDGFMEMVTKRNNHEPEFLQAVQEVAETVIPYIIKNDIYLGKNILLRMVRLGFLGLMIVEKFKLTEGIGFK
jgi:glutamate dehydrogenase (NADP+)